MGTHIETWREVPAPPERKDVPTGSSPRLADELAKIPDEPFLPVERLLVAWSLILGLALLGVLVWVSERFFSG